MIWTIDSFIFFHYFSQNIVHGAFVFVDVKVHQPACFSHSTAYFDTFGQILESICFRMMSRRIGIVQSEGFSGRTTGVVATLLSLEVLYLYHLGWINNSKTWLPGVLRTSKKPPRYHNWKFAKQNGPNICSLEGPYDIKTSGRSDMSVPQTKDTLNVTRQIAKFLVRVCNLLDTWNFLAFLTHPQYGCFQK